MRDDHRPGRGCPLHYRYSPAVFARPAEVRADVLYVAGGLYGNPFALQRVQELCAAETGDVRLVFNGDFNWFNRDPDTFAAINRAVLAHIALRGNVETELARDDGPDGCGCAYPEWVADGVVERSNQIMQVLRDTARRFPELRARLGALPMHLVAEVGGNRIAVVHGDAESLAGWSFSHESLAAAAAAPLRDWFDAAAVRVFASTHTCLPVLKRVPLSGATGLIVNNGSVGMPNLARTHYGLVTRIATTPSPGAACVEIALGDLFVGLVKVDYDHARWLELFQRDWPVNSPAHISYFERVARGPLFAGPIVV